MTSSLCLNSSPQAKLACLLRLNESKASSLGFQSKNSLIIPSKSPFKLCSSLKVKIRHFHSSFKTKPTRFRSAFKAKIHSSLQAKARSNFAHHSKQNSVSAQPLKAKSITQAHLIRLRSLKGLCRFYVSYFK